MFKVYLENNEIYKKALLYYWFQLSSIAVPQLRKDDSQPVAFSSEPQGADISLNNIPVGTTPTTVMVKRKWVKLWLLTKRRLQNSNLSA